MAVSASVSQYKPFLDLIDTIHSQAEIARYLAVSGIALLIYDWLTTLDLEVEYTWSRKWTLARVVYHLNRVLPISLIGAILIPNVLFAPAHFTPSTSVLSSLPDPRVGGTNTRDRCKKVILSYSYSVIVLLVINCSASNGLPSSVRAELILVSSYLDYSLLGIVWPKVDIMVRRKSSASGVAWLNNTRLLIPGLVVTVGHATIEVTRSIDKTTVLVNPFPDLLQGCLASIPNSIWLAYFAGVLYELVVFCLIVRRIWSLGDGLGLTPLMRQLLKNGAWFFAVNLGLMLFSCVGSAYPSTIIMANGSGLLTALSSIMCSRIYFSMHEFARGDRVRISFGPPPTTGARASAIITGQFAIQMETFSDGSRSPSGLQVTFDTPPPSLGRSVSTKGKEVRVSDKLSV
ncbi:unnamed protein product [Rhizoctonia solani]|uniref:DUF6533 domain-containing protein n=1 Tax=Rhizoctonia solani TaxID=456999 RepID=A0A8H3DVB7_9AGAM|nr:unnamed protein product [Rhizoctonia solani]